VSSASKYVSLVYKPLLTFRSAVRDERDIEAQLEDLRVKAKELRRKSKHLSLLYKKRSPETMSAITEYTKLECRMLCDKVYDTFPREVRDIMYGHIYPEEKLSVNSVSPPYMWGEGGRPAFGVSRSDRHWRTGAASDKLKHLWSADFLGNRVLLELLEWYCRATTFEFGQNWSFVPEFRSTDQWELGHVPADYVTNVEVTLDCNDYEVIKMGRGEEDGWSYAVWNTVQVATAWDDPYGREHRANVKNPRSKLLNALESLFGFKQGTKIDIHVITSEDSDWFRQGAHMRKVAVPFILPTLLRLQKAGYKVTINMAPWNKACYFKFALETTVIDLDSFEQEYVRVSCSQIFCPIPADADQHSLKPLN
jgi:hypothetical protein